MIPVQQTVFTPKLSETESADGMKTGTTTIGIVCKDSVVLAADMRATAGNLIASKRIDKVLPVTDHIAVTTAGAVSDLQLLYKYLQTELKLKQIRDGREPSVREGANLLRHWVYNLIRRQYGVVHFLVGGYDNAPRLFDIYPDGSISELDDYIASGSGSVFALGVLENRYRAGLSQDDAVQLAIDAMNSSLARDSASGNGINVYVINKDGYEKVFSQEISTQLSR